VLITVVEIVEPLPLMRLDFKFAMSLRQSFATRPKIVEIRNTAPKVFALEPGLAPAMLIASIPITSLQQSNVLGPSFVIRKQVSVTEHAAIQTAPLENPKSHVLHQRAPH